MAGLAECIDPYCIFLNSTGNYSCHLLTVSDARFIGKNSLYGICLTYNEPDSLFCASGFVCLDVLDSNKCKALDSLTMWVGRDLTTGACLPAEVGNSALCKGPDYCRLLLDNSCVLLDNTLPDQIGRQQVTTNCLTENQTAAEGCADSYCIIGGVGTSGANCVPISNDPSLPY